MRTIVVNATALDSSGALSILRQFVGAIPTNKNVEYFIFISPDIELNFERLNVRLVPIIGVKSFFKRFMWDAYGVKRWLKQNNVKPSASISLQNTNFRTEYKTPNYIYYHQPIPFATQKWSFLIKEQRILWFYKNIYPWFVALFINRRTSVFVQLEYIKNGFSEFFHFPQNRIYVITPNVDLSPQSGRDTVCLTDEKINLFYPATMFFYKNHSLLVDSLKLIDNSAFTLYLTCDKSVLPEITNELFVECIGVLSRDKMWEMYRKVDALIFPSYIETYGLPLVEAASVGLPILCSDLPYAREVLSGYDGAIFIDHTNPNAWAKAINALVKGKRYTPYQPLEKDSWNKMFEMINHNLYV